MLFRLNIKCGPERKEFQVIADSEQDCQTIAAPIADDLAYRVEQPAEIAIAPDPGPISGYNILVRAAA